MNGAPLDILERARVFSLRIIRLYTGLPPGAVGQTIGRQMLRSGTSVGAHLHEAKRSRSNAEMISKVEGGLQELEETLYWLLLLGESGTMNPARLEALRNEADELAAILVSSVKRLKSRKTYRMRAN